MQRVHNLCCFEEISYRFTAQFSSAYEILYENVEFCHNDIQWNTYSECDESDGELSPFEDKTSNPTIVNQTSQRDTEIVKITNET